MTRSNGTNAVQDNRTAKIANQVGDGPAGAVDPALEDPIRGQATSGSATPASTSRNAPSQPAVAESQVRRRLLQVSGSWLCSLAVHLLMLIALGLSFLPELPARATADLEVAAGESPVEELEQIVQFETEFLEVDDALEFEVQPATQNVELDVSFSPSDDIEAAPAPETSLWEVGNVAPLMMSADAVGSGGDDLAGRGHMARAALVRKGGGNQASETAVGNAILWLAQHQYPDGSWSFDHQLGNCGGRCRDPGSLRKATVGATALALLPFLGAGQTHTTGQYQEVVSRGLAALVRQMKPTPEGGSFMDSGNMYSHGLAAIALSEAFGMTDDPALRQPAQLALDFITNAQDPVGGGWRYKPKQAGDTSVVGWQVMALKSGHMSYLQVPGSTVRGASHFLDLVQTDGGAAYGYNKPDDRLSTTAIGLLCRMYLGWKRDHPALTAGVERLAEAGPAPNEKLRSTDFYYNYYAAQVMFQHTGAKGKMWDTWNRRLRDQLVATQADAGHERGSWIGDDPHGKGKGGRLYCTALGCMTLEVYYRHMPIYREEAVSREFPE